MKLLRKAMAFITAAAVLLSFSNVYADTHPSDIIIGNSVCDVCGADCEDNETEAVRVTDPESAPSVTDSVDIVRTDEYSKWDSREYGLITDVKSQKNFGVCWAFATCAAAEASHIKQGYAARDTIDLSEAHLANFLNPYVEGSDIPVQQDRLNNQLFGGGSISFTRGELQRGSGFTLEEKYPFTYDEATMMYSPDCMFDCDYAVDSIAVHTDMDSIKKAVMNSGAVITEFYHVSSAEGRYGEKAPYTTTYCQNSTTTSNHSVAIIGWDDNFSASNFRYKPEKDGAWLCKNSWGSNAAEDGYLWISYCDTSLKSACEIVVKPRDYDYIYQYDGNTALAAFTFSKTQTARIGNVFTADKPGYINRYGFSVCEGTYNCTVYLYSGNFTSSKSILLEKADNVRTSAAGYVTGSFKSSYKINENDVFSIVVEYKNTDKDSAYCYIPVEGKTVQFSSAADENQTFILSGSKYTDITQYKNCGNASIKAYVSYENADNQITDVPDTDETGGSGFFSADSPLFIIRLIFRIFSSLSDMFSKIHF